MMGDNKYEPGKGGVVYGPGLAIVGDTSGPEYVIPDHLRIDRSELKSALVSQHIARLATYIATSGPFKEAMKEENSKEGH